MSDCSNNHQDETRPTCRSAWKPPSESARVAALGGKFKRPQALAAACRRVPCCFPRCCVGCQGGCSHPKQQPGSFEPKIQPELFDWLGDGAPGESDRKGQTFKEFETKIFGKTKKSKTKSIQTTTTPNSTVRNVLYLCNMDDTGGWEIHTAAAQKIMGILREFVELYFGMPCRLVEPLDDVERKKMKSTRNGGLNQVLAGSLESILYQKRQKDTTLQDAFAIAGVTAMVDLCATSADTAYEFGEACPDKGVAVISLKRFSSIFYAQKHHQDIIHNCDGDGTITTKREDWQHQQQQPKSAWLQADTTAAENDDEALLVLLRSLKILAHELGHLFGLEHCVFYQCVMNGWAHLDELDESPVHLCPVCLRKLYCAVSSLAGINGRFDVLERYDRLACAMQKWGQNEAAAWYKAASARCRHRLEENQ